MACLSGFLIMPLQLLNPGAGIPTPTHLGSFTFLFQTEVIFESYSLAMLSSL